MTHGQLGIAVSIAAVVGGGLLLVLCVGVVSGGAGGVGPAGDVHLAGNGGGGGSAVSDQPGTAERSPNATLVAAYPNTVEPGNDGEFVVVRFERPTDVTGWTLTDGKTTARLPNRTFVGTVALSTTPEHAADHTDHPVVELDGRLLLAIAGDRLELRADGVTVDEARYLNAPESAVRDFEAGEWRPVGATDRAPTRITGSTATAFVLPDAADLTEATIRSANDRLLLGGYTLTSERVTEALLDAHDSGVEVRVLLDGSPVGGVDRRQARLLDRLSAAGVDVRLPAGPHVRYAQHHPKYVVADDRALVTSENFSPAGTDGRSSRGWGVVVEDAAVADELAAVHADDWAWRAATDWEDYRVGRDFSHSDPAIGEFESRHRPERFEVAATTVLVSPDNAADALVERLLGADERILIQQVGIDGVDNRLLRATLAAADRGVHVRVHLAHAWYVADDNRELVGWLNRQADAEGWDLEARVDSPDGYEKVHNKGVVVDDVAVVGSLNWGRAAKHDNREVVVALEGEAVADYYASVFDEDWSTEGDDDDELPVGLLGAGAVAVAGAMLAARRIRFRGREEVLDDWQWVGLVRSVGAGSSARWVGTRRRGPPPTRYSSASKWKESSRSGASASDASESELSASDATSSAVSASGSSPAGASAAAVSASSADVSASSADVSPSSTAVSPSTSAGSTSSAAPEPSPSLSRSSVLRSASSISASAIFSTSASTTGWRMPATNLMDPTTRWPPPETPAPGISSWSSVTMFGMSRRTPSERSTAKSGP